MEINWYGFNDYTSFGKMSKDYITELRRLGHKVYFFKVENTEYGYVRPEDIIESAEPSNSAINVVCLPFGIEVIDEPHVRMFCFEHGFEDGMNEYTEFLKHSFLNIIPCQQNAEAMKRNGFTNVEIVPYGVTQMFKPKPITFGVVCRPAFRKNLEAAIDSFEEAFYDAGSFDDVRFVVKTYKPVPRKMKKNHPHVEFIDGFFTKEQMVEFYQSLDVFVETSRGSGFGMPTIEALACGCDIIATKFGGHRDYLDHYRSKAYIVGVTMVRNNEGGLWGEVNLEELKRTYRTIATTKKRHRLRLQGFTIKDATTRLVKVLKESSRINP